MRNLKEFSDDHQNTHARKCGECRRTGYPAIQYGVAVVGEGGDGGVVLALNLGIARSLKP